MSSNFGKNLFRVVNELPQDLDPQGGPEGEQFT